MAVLETSFLIDVLRNREDAVELLDELERRETLFVTSPTIMELWEGALKSKFPANEKRRVEDLIAAVTVLDFDMRSAKLTAEINAQLIPSPIDLGDAMIAGITLTHGETLVTRDQHYARIPGLRVLKY